jgi:RNA polymerase sigma-70 factor (ECF subfamily)
MNKKFSEKLLLFKLQTKQDPEAFAELYDLYVERIYRFVFFKVANREEAEDITSEVFLKVWHYISEKKKIKSFSGLLYRTARNSIIDLYRSKYRKENPLSLSNLPEGVELGDKGKWEKDMGVSLATEELIRKIKKLKQEYQEVITLKYVDGLDTAEIAEIMEKSQTSVRVTLHRAIKRLENIIKRGQ